MAHSKQSSTRVQAAARRAEALRLRSAGRTYAEIACALGISESSAWRLVQREFDRLNAETAESARQLRQLEVNRLDTLTAALWPKASKGETQAVFGVLKIMERRARLLGLDSPTKHALEGPSGEITTEDIIKIALSPQGYGAVPGTLPPEAYLQRNEAEALARTRGIEPMSEAPETEDGDN